MDKREMIERVLGRFIGRTQGKRWWEYVCQRVCCDYDALAEQAIVMECEVEHKDIDTIPWTGINLPTKDIVLLSNPYMNEMNLSGHHGTPGKAIAIIVSLEER